jgi:tRNA(Ile)-lysidine synthase
MTNSNKDIVLFKVLGVHRQHGLFPSGGGRILVAVSGGPDSICLLHVLYRLKNEFGFEPVVAHLNHGTRGAESDGDAAFVEKLSRKLDLDYIDGKLDPDEIHRAHSASTGSAEADWREARYRFLIKAAEDRNASRIALGHNADDQIETVLIRLIRGTSPSGIKGMEFVSPPMIRPLLGVTRAEIEEYCRENNLIFRSDATNYDTIHSRNRIRLELIPLLENEYNPKVRESILRFAELLCEDIELLESLADTALADAMISRTGNKIVFNRYSLGDLPLPILSRLLRNAALSLLGPSAWRLDHSHVAAMTDSCLSKETGKIVTLPEGLRLFKKYDAVMMSIAADSADEGGEDAGPLQSTISISDRTTPIFDFSIKIEMETIEPCKELTENTDSYTAYLDRDLLGNILSIRYYLKGDSFFPLGTAGSKKLSDFFTDEKIDRDLRSKIPLLLSGNDIVWIIGKRIDNRFRVTVATKKVLKINVEHL